MNTMNRLKLLVLIAATGLGVMGSAQAQAQTTDLGTLSPTVTQETNYYQSGSSFADIYNFTVGTEYQTVLASTASYTPEGTSADATHVSNLTFTLYDSSGSELGTLSSSTGNTIDYSSFLVSGNYSLQVSGIADGSVGGGYSLSIAAIPEPAGWVTLVCGLAIVLFMARRKARLLAGDPMSA